MAKLIFRFIQAIAAVINNDPDTNGRPGSFRHRQHEVLLDLGHAPDLL